MDPKAFDHLDPKLKETYARVMGTTTNNANTPAPNIPTPQVPAADPTLSSSPADHPQSQLGTSPFGQPATPTPDAGVGPNPGTGPTITSMPSYPTTDLSAPLSGSGATADPSSTPISPPNTSFFSNPVSQPTDISAPQESGQSDLNTPVEPATEAPPVTPYSPEDLNAGQNAIGIEPMAQPLPSPSTVNQPHETSALLKVLYIVGSVIFFVVYTFFWVKVFNLPVPFLSF
jgi:hypothetical protein